MSSRGFTWLIVLLAVALAAMPAHARKKKKRELPKLEWGLDVAASAIYNDNLLGLSERDQNAFLRDPGAFPVPLESVDEFENELQIHPQLRWRAPYTTMVNADYRLKLVNRARNGFTNYQTHTFGLSVRPRTSGYTWMARGRVFTIPSFYLRAYRDRDFREYHAARFANWEYSGSLRYRFYEPLWLEIGGAWGSYYYNSKFTEYDSEYRDLSAGAIYEGPMRTRWSGSYTRRISDNIGKDQAGALGYGEQDPSVVGDSEYGDGDFTEDEFRLGAAIVLPKLLPVKVEPSLNYRLRRRVYTTGRDLDQDPFHRGRLDWRGVVSFGIKADLLRNLQADAYYGYEVRDVESEAASVPLVKDFHRREIGLTLTYAVR